MSRAARKRRSPCSVRISPRAWRWKRGAFSSRSSALICRLTADWLSPRSSPARVKLPASATVKKILILSQSTASSPRRPALFGGLARRFPGGQVSFRLERSHATHTCRGHGLSINIVGDVARGEDAGDVGRGRIRLGEQVAAGLHVELPREQLGRRLV